MGTRVQITSSALFYFYDTISLILFLRSRGLIRGKTPYPRWVRVFDLPATLGERCQVGSNDPTSSLTVLQLESHVPRTLLLTINQNYLKSKSLANL